MLYISIFLTTVYFINYITISPNIYLLVLVLVFQLAWYGVYYYKALIQGSNVKRFALGTSSEISKYLNKSDNSRQACMFTYSFVSITILTATIFTASNKFNLLHQDWLISHFYNTRLEIIAKIENVYPDSIIVNVEKIFHNQHALKLNKKYLKFIFDKPKEYSKNILPKCNLTNNDYVKTNIVLKKQIPLDNFIDDYQYDNQKDYHLKWLSKPIKLNCHQITVISKSNNGYKEYIKNKYIFYYNKIKHIGTIIALLFGDKYYINSGSIHLFQDTGTSHLIAISGMHIMMIFYLIVRLVKYLFSNKQYYKSYISNSVQSDFVALLIIVLYGFLSGFAVPAQRAIIAVLVLNLASYFKFKLSKTYLLGLCVMFVVLLDFEALSSMSFWLSFSATAWLVYMHSFRFSLSITEEKVLKNLKPVESHHGYTKSLSLKVTKEALIKNAIFFKASKWLENIIIGLTSSSSMFVCLVPITLYYFNKVALVSIIANLVAIPAISLFVLPLCFFSLSIFSLNYIFNISLVDKAAAVIINIANTLLEYLFYFLERTNDLYGAYALFADYNFFQTIELLILFLLAVIILAPKGMPKLSSSMILLFLLFFSFYNNNKNNLVLDMLDVGQGLSVLINTQNYQVLYDTGNQIKGDYLANKIIANTILQYKSKLDTLIISHWDKDHSGNAGSIVKLLNPSKLISSNLDKSAALLNIKSDLNLYYCNDSFSWFFDNIQFKFFKVYQDKKYYGNNSSCVVQVIYNNYKILLAGDIESKTEQILVDKYGNELQSDILIVPHHGSKTSSSENFIKHVKPKYALISVGQENMYGHPHKIVIDRLSRNGINILRTDMHGAIRFKINHNKISFATKKEEGDLYV